MTNVHFSKATSPMKLPYLASLFATVQFALTVSVAFAQETQSTNPMPIFTANSTILFTGDSITDGNRGRNQDPNHILGHGYQANIAARFGADLHSRKLTFLNRGVSGDTVNGLQSRIQKDLLDLKPDVLSILIGVNDLRKDPDAEKWEADYDKFLSEVTQSLPNTYLILGEPFGLPVGKHKENWEQYQGRLKVRQKIVHRLAEKYKATCIEYQAMFEEAAKKAPADYWIWDGVHPTYSGHQLMADEWIRTVRLMRIR